MNAAETELMLTYLRRIMEAQERIAKNTERPESACGYLNHPEGCDCR